MLALGLANAEQSGFVRNEAVDSVPTGSAPAAVARMIGQASVRALRTLSAERALQTGWNIADSTGSSLTLETELEERALDSYPMAAPPRNTWLRLIFEFEAVGDDVRVTARAEETWWPVNGGPSSIDVTEVYRVQLGQMLAHLARRWRGGSAVDRLSVPVLRSDAPQEVRVDGERLRGRPASELLALSWAGKAVEQLLALAAAVSDSAPTVQHSGSTTTSKKGARATRAVRFCKLSRQRGGRSRRPLS